MAATSPERHSMAAQEEPPCPPLLGSGDAEGCVVKPAGDRKEFQRLWSGPSAGAGAGSRPLGTPGAERRSATNRASQRVASSPWPLRCQRWEYRGVPQPWDRAVPPEKGGIGSLQWESTVAPDRQTVARGPLVLGAPGNVTCAVGPPLLSDRPSAGPRRSRPSQCGLTHGRQTPLLCTHLCAAVIIQGPSCPPLGMGPCPRPLHAAPKCQSHNTNRCFSLPRSSVLAAPAAPATLPSAWGWCALSTLALPHSLSTHCVPGTVLAPGT